MAAHSEMESASLHIISFRLDWRTTHTENISLED
jgi:hypothetical protein